MLLSLSLIYFIIDPRPLPTMENIPILIRWIFVSVPNEFAGPLWYLTAVFWGLITFRLYQYLFKGRHISWLILLSIFGFVIGKYRFLFDGEKSSYFAFNFISYALPCFAIGYLIHKHEERIVRWHYLSDTAIITMFLLWVEVYFLRAYSDGRSGFGASLLCYPACACLVALALKHRDFGTNSILMRIGRDYSSHIYYWHMLFVFALLVPLREMPRTIILQTIDVFSAPIIFIISLLFSIFVVWLQKRIGYTLFK